jgi:hypothetical protein
MRFFSHSVTLVRNRYSGPPTKKVYKKRIVYIYDFDIWGHLGGRIGVQIGHSNYEFVCVYSKSQYGPSGHTHTLSLFSPLSFYFFSLSISFHKFNFFPSYFVTMDVFVLVSFSRICKKLLLKKITFLKLISVPVQKYLFLWNLME